MIRLGLLFYFFPGDLPNRFKDLSLTLGVMGVKYLNEVEGALPGVNEKRVIAYNMCIEGYMPQSFPLQYLPPLIKARCHNSSFKL